MPFVGIITFLSSIYVLLKQGNRTSKVFRFVEASTMIDCHCHLCDSQFENDLDEVIENAKRAGVIACVVNTENESEFERVLNLATKYAGWLFPCIGVHPAQYDALTKQGRSVKRDEINGLSAKLAQCHQEIVAIGEVGLDYTPRYIQCDDDKLAQKDVLKAQIELAKLYDLPLNVHSRSAGRPVIDFLIENGAKKVLLHAFSGNYKSALPAIKAGYYFSVPPCSINSEQKQKLIEKIPIEQLALETDSPVLGPNGEQRNEPANLIISCQFIAELKKMDIEDVKRITTSNALKLFPKVAKVIKP